MPEPTIDVEGVGQLEKELREKMGQLQKILGELQAQSAQSPQELLKGVGDVAGVKVIAEALKEMETTVSQKRNALETALKELQSEMAALGQLKSKAAQGDVTDELKALVARVRDKKEMLKQMIGELEGLRAEYVKKFLR